MVVSVPMATTFTGTATVLPVSTAVFKISVSYRERQSERGVGRGGMVGGTGGGGGEECRHIRTALLTQG